MKIKNTSVKIINGIITAHLSSDNINSQNTDENNSDNDDWFDVIPVEQINKNDFIPNKIIGVNTIYDHKGSRNVDIRGHIAAPKFIVAPWLQSTIEPDYNLKSLC